MLNRLHQKASKVRIVKGLLVAGSKLKNRLLGYDFSKELENRLVFGWQGLSILDVGSGAGEAIRSQEFQDVDITCLDIYKPYLLQAQKKGFKVLNVDARKIPEYFLPKSFDIVLALDFLEHLKKPESLKLLKYLEQVARKQVVVWIPLGAVPQDLDITGMGGDKYQRHRSTWLEEDFVKLGYKCQVLKGYHKDIQIGFSKKLKPQERMVDAMWAIKNL